MMKKRVLVMLSVVLLLLTTACFCSVNGTGAEWQVNVSRSAGAVVEEEREISAATAVELDGFGVVHFVQGETPALMIEAEQGYLDNLETLVSGDRLIIRPRKAWLPRFVPSATPHYYLTLPDVEEIVLSGAVKFEADTIKAGDLLVLCNGGNELTIETIEAEKLVLKAAGAANWSLNEIFVTDTQIEIAGMTNATIADLQGENFELEINGAASATVAGSVTTQLVEIAGTGSYQAGDLESKDATIKVSGASSIVVWATEDLHLDCDGAGRIDYWGSPRVTQDNAGLAIVNSLGEKESDD